MLWSARRARVSAIWGSAVVALFVSLYGIGIYLLFTDFWLDQDLDNPGSLVLLFLSPFILSVVAGIASWRLAKYVGILSKQPLAPEGSKTARRILWFSVFLWAILWLAFLVSIATSIDQSKPEGDRFPSGIIISFPVFLGFCVGIYSTGAAFSAWSKDNKVETLLIIGLAWAAFAMFLLLPTVINSWHLESETPNVEWDNAVWWLRFGSLFPAIAPWLIVVGLYFVHGRSIALLKEAVELDKLPRPYGSPADATSGDACPRCGGSISTHPRTLETFCSACGWGLQPEDSGPVIVDAAPAPTHGTNMFVEQPKPAPAPPAQEPAARTPLTCSQCGGELAVLSQTRQIYCTACGAGLPSERQLAPPSTPEPASVAPPPAAAAPPVPPSAPAPSPPPPSAGVPPGPCPLCGAPTTVHPRTGERFCPACGAGLRPG